jgi:hypothetical protein
MRRYLIAILLLICSSSAVQGAEKIKPANCRAPELFGDPPYDDLVCTGIAMMVRHDYRRAIDSFERALKINLFEWPNFMLLPRLALAYHRAGDRAKAAEMLEKAELTLQVFTKMLACVATDGDNNSIIIHNYPGPIYPIKSPYHQEVVKIMCGDAFESNYEFMTLEGLAGEGPLLRNYVTIKRKIEGKK